MSCLYDEHVLAQAIDHLIADRCRIEKYGPDRDQEKQQRKKGEEGVVRKRSRPLGAVDIRVLDHCAPQHADDAVSWVTTGCGSAERHRGNLAQGAGLRRAFVFFQIAIPFSYRAISACPDVTIGPPLVESCCSLRMHC